MKRLLTSLFIIAAALMTWAQKTPQVIWTEGNTTLTFINDDTVYAEGDTFNGETVTKVWIRPGHFTGFNVAVPGWNTAAKDKATTVVFDESFQDVTPISGHKWFEDFKQLTSIEGMQFLNTSKMQTFDYMFKNCSLLTSLDVSHFNTSSGRYFQSTFHGCSSLTSLDVSRFDTSRAISLYFMFGGCTNLQSLDLSSFRTPNVERMYGMFSGCKSLKELDLSSFHTPSLKYINGLFHDCESLETLDISNFNTEKVEGMATVFYNCKSLRTLDLSNFRTPNVTTMSQMFMYCSALKTLDLSTFNTSMVTNLQETFYHCTSLTDLNISSFNTSRVETMDRTFCGLKNLRNIDLSNFKTNNCTTMEDMFANSGFEHLDLSNFNTSKVTRMPGMFNNLTNLQSIDVSKFNTSRCRNMSRMFNNCKKLTYLDVRNFDTSNVRSMQGFCYNCSGLYYLDLTNFILPTSTPLYWTDMCLGMDTTFVYANDAVAEKIKDKHKKNLIVGDKDNGFTCNDCWLYDKREPRIPYPFDADKVTYERTIAKGGNGNTIMLPCDVEVPSGMKAYQMRPSENQVRDEIIYFQELPQGETMKANTPYLIANWGKSDAKSLYMPNTTYVNNTIDYYDLEGTTQLTSYAGSETVETTLKDGTHVTMSGTFRTMPNSEVADQGIYIFQTGNKWKQVKSSNTSAYIRPYRAYLTKTGGGPSGVSLFNSVLMADTDETTAVEELHLSSPNDGSVQYDLSGRRVSGPRKGIRVTKGKKVSTTKLSL